MMKVCVNQHLPAYLINMKGELNVVGVVGFTDSEEKEVKEKRACLASLTACFCV